MGYKSYGLRGSWLYLAFITCTIHGMNNCWLRDFKCVGTTRRKSRKGPMATASLAPFSWKLVSTGIWQGWFWDYKIVSNFPFYWCYLVSLGRLPLFLSHQLSSQLRLRYRILQGYSSSSDYIQIIWGRYRIIRRTGTETGATSRRLDNRWFLCYFALVTMMRRPALMSVRPAITQ